MILVTENLHFIHVILIMVNLGNKFSRVPTYHEPIVALVYQWYTKTEHNGRKDKMNAFVYVIFYIYIIYIYQSYQDERYINVSQQLDIYIYYFMCKQYVKGVQKWKKLTWCEKVRFQWSFTVATQGPGHDQIPVLSTDSIKSI